MWIARPFASLAQLVEHVICNLGVVGSSPTRGSLTRLVLETISTIYEQIAKLSSLLSFSYLWRVNEPFTRYAHASLPFTQMVDPLNDTRT